MSRLRRGVSLERGCAFARRDPMLSGYAKAEPSEGAKVCFRGTRTHALDFRESRAFAVLVRALLQTRGQAFAVLVRALLYFGRHTFEVLVRTLLSFGKPAFGEHGPLPSYDAALGPGGTARLTAQTRCARGLRLPAKDAVSAAGAQSSNVISRYARAATETSRFTLRPRVPKSGQSSRNIGASFSSASISSVNSCVPRP